MNNWNLIILKKAEKYLKKLSSNEQKRIIQALKLLIQDPNQVDIKQLQGRLEYRLRVVNFRILYRKDEPNLTYVITKIKSRGDVYK